MEMKISTIAFYLCLILCLCSCGNSRKKDAVLLTELTRSELILPPAPTTNQPRILVYVGEGECGVCSLRLPEWYTKINELRQTGIDSMQVLFVVEEREMPRMEAAVAESHIARIREIVAIRPDSSRLFLTTNPIPSDYRFHTFLLDKENRVVLVGSPIGNPKMWNLYKSTIARLAAHGGTLPDKQTKMPLGQ